MWSVIFVPHWGQNFFAISGKSSNCMIWRNSFARFGGGRGKRTRNAAANRAIFPESPLVKFAKIHTRGVAGLLGFGKRDVESPLPVSGLGAVAVGDEAVFRPGLAVMAGLAESLPVGFVPEKIPVATMGDDVVDYRCRGQPSLLAAANAERVVQQEGFACRLPAFCVASAVSRGALRIGLVLGLMQRAVHSSGQVGTAGMVARFPGSVGHGNASFHLGITSS